MVIIRGVKFFFGVKFFNLTKEDIEHNNERAKQYYYIFII
jgi:hypothetical protein